MDKKNRSYLDQAGGHVPLQAHLCPFVYIRNSSPTPLALQTISVVLFWDVLFWVKFFLKTFGVDRWSRMDKKN